MDVLLGSGKQAGSVPAAVGALLPLEPGSVSGKQAASVPTVGAGRSSGGGVNGSKAAAAGRSPEGGEGGLLAVVNWSVVWVRLFFAGGRFMLAFSQ